MRPSRPVFRMHLKKDANYDANMNCEPRKTGLGEVEFVVAEGSDEIEAETVATATVAVALGEDAEDLQGADDVLGHYPLLRQRPVGRPLLRRERVELGASRGGVAVLVHLLQPLIAAVRQSAHLIREGGPALLEEGKVVSPPLTEGGGDDPLRLLVSDELALLRVPLLLPAVRAALLFFSDAPRAVPWHQGR